MSETLLPSSRRLSRIERSQGLSDAELEQRTGVRAEALQLVVDAALRHADEVNPMPATEGPKPIFIGDKLSRAAHDQAGFGHSNMWMPGIIGQGELNYRPDRSDTPPAA